MAGQIPQALGILSQFLNEENARLDAEIKERDIRQTIDYAANEFSKIGPDATPQDVRKVYYNALDFASRNKSEEAVQLISGLFSESAQFVRQEKMDRQDENLTKALGDMTGINVTGLSGQGAGVVANYDLSSTKFFQTRTKEGTSYAQAYKLKQGSYKPVEEKIDIDLSTFKDRAEGKYQIRNSGGNDFQKTVYSTMQGDPVYLNPQYGGGHFVVDAKTGQFERYTGDVVVREDSYSKVRARSFREAEQQQDVSFAELQTGAKAFAGLLLKYGDNDTILKSSVFKNINSDDFRNENYETLDALQSSGKLEEVMANVKPENQDLLWQAYSNFLDNLNNYRDSKQQFRKFKGDYSEPKENQDPNYGPPKEKTSDEVLLTMRNYADNIFKGVQNDPKAKSKWQQWIATNLRVTNVTDLNQLTPDQQAQFLSWLARATNVKGVMTIK